MTTRQLIILWWGFTALIIAMLMGLNQNILIALSLLLLIVLISYGFKKHPHKISRHKMMIAIGFPMMALGIIGFISGGSVDNPELDFNTNMGISLPTDSVKIISPQITHKFFMDTLTGNLQNNSQMNIDEVNLRVLLDANTAQSEEWNVPLKNLNLSPGQTIPFKTQIGDFHFRANKKWKWTFQVKEVNGG